MKKYVRCMNEDEEKLEKVMTHQTGIHTLAYLLKRGKRK